MARILTYTLAILIFWGGILCISEANAKVARETTEIVTEVYDGDTYTIARTIKPWNLPIRMRIRGIDTPEIGAKARCERENELGIAAKHHLNALIAVSSRRVRVSYVDHDKYGGRLDHDAKVKVGIHDVDLKQAQINAGHAVAYEGEGARKDWCSPAADPVNLLEQVKEKQ